MARTTQVARQLYHRDMNNRNKNKKPPEFQNFTFSPNIQQQKQNFPMSKSMSMSCTFYEINHNLSIYSLMKKCLQDLPKDFKLITSSNNEYMVNKVIIFHTSNLIKKMIEESPDLSSYQIQTNSCDTFISKFSSILSGNSEKITKDDVKIAKKIAKELQIDGFPIWMKPHKQRSATFNYQNQFARKPPKFSIISITSLSFISFLRYQKCREFYTIKTQNNTYKVPLFGAFCSSSILDHYKQNIQTYSIKNYINNVLIDNDDNNNDNDSNDNNNDNNNDNDNTNINNNDIEIDDNNEVDEINCFLYDYEDANKEFEALANFMSGDFYNLVTDNMELSLKFSKELGIIQLYDTIRKVIEEYDQRNKLIQDNLSILNDEIFITSQINRFRESQSNSKSNPNLVNEVFQSLFDSIWCQDSEHVKEMTKSIIRLSSNNYKIIDQISQLLVLLDKAKDEREPLSSLYSVLVQTLFYNPECINNPMNPSYSNNHIQSININSQIILHLKKHNFFTSKDIVFMIGGIGILNSLSNTKRFSYDRDGSPDAMQQNINYSNLSSEINIRPIHYFFSPEIEEVFPNCLPESCIINDSQRFAEGEEGSLMNIIFNDDIEQFKSVESSSLNFELNQTVFFPNNFDFIELSLVEYAAIVDSPKIFNYIFSKFDQNSHQKVEMNSDLNNDPYLETFTTNFLRNINFRVLFLSMGKSRSIVNSILPYIEDIIKERELQKQEFCIINQVYYPFNIYGNNPQLNDIVDKSRTLSDYIDRAITTYDNELLEYFAKKSNQYLLCQSMCTAIECHNTDAFLYLSKLIPFFHTGERLSFVGFMLAKNNYTNFFIFLSKIFDISKLIGHFSNFQLPNHIGMNELTIFDGICQSNSVRILKFIFDNYPKAKTYCLGRFISEASRYNKFDIVEYSIKVLKQQLLPREIINIISYLYYYGKPEIGKIIFESNQIPEKEIFYFIEVAAASGDLEFVSSLIEKQLEIKPNTTFKDAFNAAARFGKLEVCQYIASIKSEPIINERKDDNNKDDKTNNNENHDNKNDNENKVDQNNNNNDNENKVDQNNNNNNDNESNINQNNNYNVGFNNPFGYNFDDDSDDDNENPNEIEVHVYNPVENLSSVDFRSTITSLVRSTLCYCESTNPYLNKHFVPTQTAIEVLKLYFGCLQNEELKESVIRALQESICINNDEIANFLLSYKIKDESSLVMAARNGMFEVVKKLIELDPSDSFVNYVHGFYGTALNSAVDNGHAKIVDFLLSLPNIDVNLTDFYHMSPLVTSAFNRRYEMFIKIVKTKKFSREEMNKALLFYCRNTKLIQPYISPSSPSYFSLMVSPNMSSEDIQVQKAQTAVSLVNCQASDDQLRSIFPNIIFERLRGVASFFTFPIKPETSKENEKEDPRFINFFFGLQEKIEFDPLIDLNEIEKCRKLIDFNFFYIRETFLIAACKFGRIELVKLLLQQPGTNINAYDNKGNTPLIHAVAQGHFEIVRLLCESKSSTATININQNNFFNRTAFTFAASVNRIDILKYIATREGFDSLKSQACTAAASSIIHNHSMIFKLLLEGNTKTKVKDDKDDDDDDDNKSGLFIDFDVNKEIVFNHLWGISDPSIKQSVLQMPAFGNFNKVFVGGQQRNRFIENSSWSLLRVAVQREDVEALRVISNHPRFNASESNADRALFYATKCNNLSVFKAMLDISRRDVNFNYKGKESRSLLCTAVSNRSDKIIKYIIEHPQFDPIKSHSNLAFFAALLSQPLDIIKICSKIKGIDFNSQCPKIPQELMSTSYGQFYNKNVEGITPLYIAATTSPDVLSFLLNLPNSNIDVNCRNSDGSTPIFGAIQLHVSLDLLLRQKGVDVNAQDNNGRTVLMCMVMQRLLQCAPMILARDDVDLSVRDKEGKNVLMYANPTMNDVDPKSISWKEASEILLQSAYLQQDFY